MAAKPKSYRRAKLKEHGAEIAAVRHIATREVYEASKPDAIESLGRIEGESNFSSLLAGIEAGRDTTQDMGACAMARSSGCIPEVLEAYVAQSKFYRLPLMSMVFKAIVAELRSCTPRSQRDKLESRLIRDRAWMQGAVADAFLLLRYGHCKSLSQRAKHFEVDHDAYAAIRKVAHGIFNTLRADAERLWKIARFSRGRAPSKEHATGEGGTTTAQRASIGSYRAGPLPDADAQSLYDGETIQTRPGVRIRGFWNERFERSPVTLTKFA
jgi:hypothetical protein